MHVRSRRHRDRLPITEDDAEIDDAVCYGFRVGGDVPLIYPRTGGAPTEGAPLVVSEVETPDPDPDEPALREWLPRAENPLHAKLFRDDDGWRLWVDGTGTYMIDPEGTRIGVPAGAHPVRREERMWGIPTVLCFQPRGDHSLHAAAIEIGGRALAFAAPGRHGKTTMATALVAAGHRLLSEDSTCVRLDPGPAVLPGPAMLRVRPDTFAAVEFGRADVVLRDDDRVHVALDGAGRGDGRPVPLAGIVLLHVGDTISVERVDPTAAIQDLWALSLQVPTDEERAAAFARITTIAATVPVWNLARPMRYDILPDVIETIVTSCVS